MTILAAARRSPSHPFYILPDGWDQGWKAALAANQTTPCWIGVLGDSDTQGIGATDYTKGGWFMSRLRDTILARSGVTHYADWWPPCDSQAFFTAAVGGLTYQGTPPWSFASTTNVVWDNYWLNTMPIVNQAAMPGTVTWTAPYSSIYTALDVVWCSMATAAGVTMTYNLNGGGGVVLTHTEPTTTGAGLAGNAAGPWRSAVSGALGATPVLNFTAQSATFGFSVLGIAAYTSRTAGVGFAKMASSGNSLRAIGKADGWPVDKLKILQGQEIGRQVTSVSNATPPVVLHPRVHGYTTGDKVTLEGTTVAAYNKEWTITVTSTTQYSLNGGTAAGAATGGWANKEIGFGFPFAPQLTIIALGGNDCQQLDYGPDGFAQNCKRIIQAVRRGSPNCSILFVGQHFPDPVNSDHDGNGNAGIANSPMFNPDSWPYYVMMQEQIAFSEKCGFVNMHAKWGQNQTPVADGYLTQSDIHPNNTGHQDIAGMVAAVI